MKFKNILVVLNPENEKQYALARAVRLAKEQKNETKVKNLPPFYLYMIYLMKCLPYFLQKNVLKCIVR